jgi:hypothetical protein
MVLMRKHLFVVTLGLLLLLSGRSVFAVDTEPCRKGCETGEVACRARADSLPNELDRVDAYRVCEDEIKDCCDLCTPEKEKAEREQQKKVEQEKAEQEKKLKEQQQDKENSPIESPQSY